MAKAMPPQPRPAAAARPAAKRPENTLPPLRITYYRRMRRQRVYTVKVAWSNDDHARPPAGAKPVTLRLLMAGAQVVPAEQWLDPAKPDATASFHVTPLAKGHLRGERLEILIDDRKVQEVRLHCKVASQRLTLALLVLAFLVPWFLLHYTKYAPLSPVGKEFGFVQRTPGALLKHRLEQNMPDMPDLINDHVPVVREWLVTLREKLADFYELLYLNRDEPLAFYSAVALLLLTAVSWWLHRPKRKKLLSKPIPLPALAGVPTADSLDEDED